MRVQLVPPRRLTISERKTLLALSTLLTCHANNADIEALERRLEKQDSEETFSQMFSNVKHLVEGHDYTEAMMSMFARLPDDLTLWLYDEPEALSRTGLKCITSIARAIKKHYMSFERALLLGYDEDELLKELI